MKSKAAFVDILYLIFSIGFYLLLIGFIFILAAEAFTSDGKIGRFTSNYHSSVGYSLPVEFEIKPKNPMYGNVKIRDYKEYLDEDGIKRFDKIPQYLNAITKNDSINFNSVVSVNKWAEKSDFKLMSKIFNGDGVVYVKPDSTYNKTIIITRSFLNLIFLILIFLLLKNIFNSLRFNVQFSVALYKRTQTLGVIILASVVITLLANYLLGDALSDISIHSLDYKLTYVDIIMKPRLDFNFTLFIIGLSLITLGSLLKSGNRFQDEDKLTI